MYMYESKLDHGKTIVVKLLKQHIYACTVPIWLDDPDIACNN